MAGFPISVEWLVAFYHFLGDLHVHELIFHVRFATVRIQDFAAQLLLPNVFTGYAYLLDKDNKIRWKGSGQALESEVETLLQCTDQLLQER